MATYRTRLGPGGRLVIPAPQRRALGLKPGDEVLIEDTPDALRVVTIRRAIREAQDRIRRHVPAGRSLVQELIEERRRESRRG